MSVVFSPDSTVIASGSRDRYIKISTVDGNTQKSFTGHTDIVTCVVFTEDGLRLVSASGDKSIKVWEIRTGNIINNLVGHVGCIGSIAVRNGTIVSGSNDKKIRVWSLERDECLKVLTGHTEWIWTVDISPCGNLIASGSEDQTIRIWNRDGVVQTIPATLGVFSVKFTPCGRKIVSGHNDSYVRIWDSKNNKTK